MNAAHKLSAPNRASFAGLELRCPPLPQTLTEALDLMQRPDQLEMGRVIDMVQRDPVVVARLLNIVNSAYYGLRHQITSADRAVVMLGPVAVAGIVVGMQMLKLRELMDGPAGDCFNRLIHHSIATAFLTRHLVDGAPRERASRTRRIGPSYTGGLLHDFGKIILVYNFPQKAVSLYEEQALQAHVATEDETEIEQLLFGYDHTEAGEYVARKLNFPDQLVDVIRLHHEPKTSTGSPETDRLVRAVSAADAAARAMGFAFTRPMEADDVRNLPVWEKIASLDVRNFSTGYHLADDVLGLQSELEEYIRLMGAPQPAAPIPLKPHSRVSWNRSRLS